MKTKREIIDETAQVYNSENRCYTLDTYSYTGEKCLYYHDEKMCAVGRCLENAKQFSIMRGSVKDFDKEHGLNENLKPEYRGHEIEFWADLQDFHDTEANWDENGLTHEGHVVYNKLIETYGE